MRQCYVLNYTVVMLARMHQLPDDQRQPWSHLLRCFVQVSNAMLRLAILNASILDFVAISIQIVVMVLMKKVVVMQQALRINGAVKTDNRFPQITSVMEFEIVRMIVMNKIVQLNHLVHLINIRVLTALVGNHATG